MLQFIATLITGIQAVKCELLYTATVTSSTQMQSKTNFKTGQEAPKPTLRQTQSGALSRVLQTAGTVP